MGDQRRYQFPIGLTIFDSRFERRQRFSRSGDFAGWSQPGAGSVHFPRTVFGQPAAAAERIPESCGIHNRAAVVPDAMRVGPELLYDRLRGSGAQPLSRTFPAELGFLADPAFQTFGAAGFAVHRGLLQPLESCEFWSPPGY